MNRSPVRTAVLSVVVVVLAVAAMVSWPMVTSAAPSADAAGTGPILFADDFDGPAGSAPDPLRWEDYSTCSYNSSAAFGSITCGNNEKLDGAGHLVVPATPQAGSAIRSSRTSTFQYGTMSAWIRFPAQAGYWPAFWSLNSRYDGREELPLGEADAMEGYTTWLDAYHATAHDYGTGGARYSSADEECPGSTVDLSAAYHKYSARIEPGRVTFFFDDVQCGAVHTKAAGKPWGFGPDVTRGNWLILDLAIGGADGQQRKPTANARMLVDRVEVRAPAPPTSAPTTSAPTTTRPVPTTTVPVPTTTRLAPTLIPPATLAPTSTPSSPSSTNPSAPGPVAVQDLAVYRLVSTCGAMALDVPDSSTVAGKPLRTAAWSGRDTQRWRLVSVGASYYELQNVGSGLVASVLNASTANGALVVQQKDTSAANAQWRITARTDGAFQLTARHSGKPLDVRKGDAAPGAVVDQAAPAPGCAQAWTLVRS